MAQEKDWSVGREKITEGEVGFEVKSGCVDSVRTPVVFI